MGASTSPMDSNRRGRKPGSSPLQCMPRPSTRSQLSARSLLGLCLHYISSTRARCQQQARRTRLPKPLASGCVAVGQGRKSLSKAATRPTGPIAHRCTRSGRSGKAACCTLRFPLRAKVRMGRPRRLAIPRLCARVCAPHHRISGCTDPKRSKRPNGTRCAARPRPRRSNGSTPPPARGNSVSQPRARCTGFRLLRQGWPVLGHGSIGLCSRRHTAIPSTQRTGSPPCYCSRHKRQPVPAHRRTSRCPRRPRAPLCCIRRKRRRRRLSSATSSTVALRLCPKRTQRWVNGAP
mmetsp:Transcript_22068/g.63146  ORF Transcript_22068/g.63146 Transcript_22068/m.63146 type:complete len:292 (+) Transcript_22068:1320-2195(+)